MIELRIEKLRFAHSRSEVDMVMSEFNQTNPVTNHQCDFGQLIVNVNSAQIQSVRKHLKTVRKTNKSNPSQYPTKHILFRKTGDTNSVH